MKVQYLLSCLFTSCVILSSCSVEGSLSEQSDIKTKITCSVDEFASPSNSRTNVDPSNNYAITWASGDVIGIFPREGYQEPFEIPAAQVGQSKAAFDGGYWALKSGLTYNAYYPFDKANFDSSNSKTTIPVTYLGQEQIGTTCCAGKYDYTYSDWATSDGGALNFKFHHIGAFYVLSLKIPEKATYTSLTITSNGNAIPTTGTYDLTASKPTFVAKTYSSSLTINLKNFSATAGDVAKFYIMLPPVDLSSATLIATLSNEAKTYKYVLPSQNIEAAHLYKVEGELANVHESVDLGLSVKWATCNIGANKPEEYGNLYAWAETESKSDYTWANYIFRNGKYNPITKYNKDDNLIVLDAVDDVANVLWGESDNWRVPTIEEMKELANNCVWTRTSLNGIEGFEVAGNGNCIFIPFVGSANDGNSYVDNETGYYWSSSLHSSDCTKAQYMHLWNGGPVFGGLIDRYYGCSVRAVLDK